MEPELREHAQKRQERYSCNWKQLSQKETLNRFLSGHSCAFLKLDGLKGDVEGVWLYLLPPRVANTPPISAIHFLDMVPDLDGANGFENIASIFSVFCVFYKVRPVCPGAPSLFQLSSPPFDTLAHLSILFATFFIL